MGESSFLKAMDAQEQRSHVLTHKNSLCMFFSPDFEFSSVPPHPI